MTGADLVEPSANCTAASTFKLPAPVATSPDPAMNELVTCRMAFASRGDSLGRCSNKSATAPLTTPAAMLVPDSCM